jgi:DNA-binding transcriptional ArsR family regulator
MPSKPAKPMEPGRFAYQGLDRVLHERARLSILSCLAAHRQGLLFNDLKGLCALTDGNLSRHLQMLEEAGIVDIWKGIKNKRPQTLCRLTPQGNQRFLDYLAVLEQVITDAAARQEQASPAPRAPGRGLAPS